MLQDPVSSWVKSTIFTLHPHSACLTKLGAETTLFAMYIFFFFVFGSSHGQVCCFFLPSLTFTHPPSFSSLLSRSCKLQIRNIPPHMQWEVSANRLLTASRVARYRDSRPGSSSGVWSHLPLPSFGLLLWDA